jgi:ABC-type amino acid transport substrate-binding protein
MFYINPNALFTERALKILNWTVEDVEEFVGIPRGYTDIEYKDDEYSDIEIRLNSLRKHGGDETLQKYLDKYLKKSE